MTLLDELQLIYIDMLKLEEAIGCAHEKTERVRGIYEESDWFLINHYKSTARFYVKIAQFERALQLTELRLGLLLKVRKSFAQNITL